MPPDPLRILLVEDNPNNRRVAHAILSRRGHRVDSAENGRLALEKLAGSSGSHSLLSSHPRPEKRAQRIRAGKPEEPHSLLDKILVKVLSWYDILKNMFTGK